MTINASLFFSILFVMFKMVMIICDILFMSVGLLGVFIEIDVCGGVLFMFRMCVLIFILSIDVGRDL